MSLASFSLVKDFANIGFGIGYLTKEFIKEELENKELFELHIKEKIPNRYIGIAYIDNAINYMYLFGIFCYNNSSLKNYNFIVKFFSAWQYKKD